jgi:hypothetical protein
LGTFREEVPQDPSYPPAIMPTPITDAQLRSVRSRDRLTFQGKEWQVKDYSTYADDTSGYKTEEWQLQTDNPTNSYYLLREFDPKPQKTTWYLAESLNNPTIVAPGTFQDLRPKLAEQMRKGEPAPPKLQVLNQLYQFESSTKGRHQSGNDQSDRVTWDYWDSPHQSNLALEAWDDGTLEVYSTHVVDLNAFTRIQQESGQIPYQLIGSVLLCGLVATVYMFRQRKG